VMFPARVVCTKYAPPISSVMEARIAESFRYAGIDGVSMGSSL